MEFTEERQRHILDAHPELGAHLADILGAVTAPTKREAGRQSNEVWYFLRGAGRSRWLQVVVAYAQGQGWIVTAFAGGRTHER